MLGSCSTDGVLIKTLPAHFIIVERRIVYLYRHEVEIYQGRIYPVFRHFKVQLNTLMGTLLKIRTIKAYHYLLTSIFRYVSEEHKPH